MAARLNKNSPRPATVKCKGQHWTRRLDAFRLKHQLSERDLMQVLSGVWSKSYIHEVLSGSKRPQREEMTKSFIAARLREFLKSKKLSKLAIEREIIEIFHEAVCPKENQSVISRRTELPIEVQRHFGLSHDPFPNEPPRSKAETFTNRDLDKIASRLEDAVNYQGFVAVIGESGSGKSFMRRRLVQTCRDSHGKMLLHWPEFSNMTKVHDGSICSFILHEYNQPAPRDLVDRYSRLKRLLEGFAAEGKRVAIGFDECHRLDPRLLIDLKNFWEIGSGGYERWLGVVLFGQPPLLNTLNDIGFQEITKRLNIIRIPTLGKDAWAYCVHRFKLAGANAEKRIDSAVVSKLAAIDATPLGLGNLINLALIQAHKLNEPKVTLGVIRSSDDLRRSIDGPEVRAARRA